MTNVLLMSKYGNQGASSRLRTQQYIPMLRNHGVEVTRTSLFDDKYLLKVYEKGGHSAISMANAFIRRLCVLLTARQYDIIWIEKEIFPYMPAWAERLLRYFDIPYIVDYDDAIFHNYDLSKNPLLRITLKNKIDVVMRNAQSVVVGNSYLGQRAAAAGARDIIEIPTVVDRSRYFPAKKRPQNPNIIGWIGSPSTEKYVADLAVVLQKIGMKHNIRILAVGATDNLAVALQGIDVKIVPWNEETEAKYISEMTIGIMPLRDGPWEQGKCGYKLIQYMASQIPVVASNVGVNPKIIGNGSCGITVNTDEEWISAIDAMLLNPDKANKMGEIGRTRVESIYSTQAQIENLAKVLSRRTA